MEVAAGTVVDGRYRILNRIGSGGMADVYLAEDAHLGRQVALKVLHRRFAQDQQFVERFRREASSAAGLQHPNVVNVFDRGDHEGTYYIAMEYLQGRTLKDVLSADGPMDQIRAIDIALKVLAAAAFAHKRGVIHRDFKPHNVMLGSDDSVKVTDFGIARAGASEMTETGSIMGTAQYLSPEQAQGHAVIAASDLYSIGVLLYEMVAGQLPFTGDSAVAIALHHLNDPPPPLAGIRPDVNPVLEAAIMRALVKDPAGRYAEAEEFAAALVDARSAVEEGRTDGGQSTAAFAPVPEPVLEPDVEPARRHWGRWALLGIALLLAGAALYFLVLAPASQVTAPGVVGQPEPAARVTIEKAKLKVGEVTRRADVVVPVGAVIAQDPQAGEKVDEESKVDLVVSTGPTKRTVPAVAGQTEQQAVKELTKAGFKIETTERASSAVKKGNVIGTSPSSGTDAPVGSRIILKVSSGPEQVTVPDVVGITEESATSQLDSRGLLVARKTQESDEAEGTVIAQDPAADSKIAKGARVTLTVSKPQQQVSVPDVVDLTESDASGELRSAGFNVLSRERLVTDDTEDGQVLEQRPSSGRMLRKGATVTIFVGKLDTATVPGEPPPP